MEKIFAENRKLELQKQHFVERNEKLRLAQQKIQELDKELNEKKELLKASESTKIKLIMDKNEIEEKNIDLEDKLKKTTARYQAINNQCDETIAENQVLQTKLNSHNNSFVSTGGDANQQPLELIKANYERDVHKWNAEKLQNNARVNELEQMCKLKEEDAKRREQQQAKKHRVELQELQDGYDEQLEDA